MSTSQDSYAQGLKTAIGLLSRREHSRLEIQLKLLSRGIEDDVIGRILDFLVSQNYLDEHRFIEAYIHSRQQKGYGPQRIRMELRERGIDDGMLQAYLDERDSYWQKQARVVQLKKFGTELPESAKDKARQIRFLQHRGFSSNHINRLFRGDSFI
jgi:regulatory protein